MEKEIAYRILSVIKKIYGLVRRKRVTGKAKRLVPRKISFTREHI